MLERLAGRYFPITPKENAALHEMDVQSPHWSDGLMVVGAPAILAIVEIFHPHPHDILRVDVQRWLAIHYAQILLFPLSALSVVTLLRGKTDAAAIVSRVAMFLFAVSYIAFDTAAGVVTGILVKAAHDSGAFELWHIPIQTIWQHPVVGGVASPFLAVFGSVALSVGTVTAGISLKRAGNSWVPVLLLAASGFGIGVFKTHAWPGGPLTFAGLAVAGAWVLWERARTARSGNPT